jgi:large subunit ribosomal protein L4e
MKVSIIDSKNATTGTIELPPQFAEPVRTDLVKRAVLTINANTRQPYGSDPEAGQKAAAKLSRRRRNYRGSYGIGISRVPRKIMSRRGTRMNWVGAVAPGTVKGRRAHPPKVEKIWAQKLNTKERRKAIRSALAATMDATLVAGRGHRIPKNFPFIIDSAAESLAKTKDVQTMLMTLGFADELARTAERSVRPGRGKMRGRRYRTKTGPLIVVGSTCKLIISGKNIPGVDTITVDKLNASALAPGIKPGRLTLFTEAAIKRLATEKLFTDAPVVRAQKKA